MTEPTRFVGSADSSLRRLTTSWQQLIHDWSKRRDLVPITGAGVGRNFCLPTWLELIERLCRKYENLSGDSADDIRRQADINLQTFLVLKRLEGLKENPTEAVRVELYRDFHNSSPGAAIWLECLVELAAIRGRYVTFNFDEIFEIYVKEISRCPFNVVGSIEGPRGTRDHIDCFHVHGFLPRSGSGGPLVFDQISYAERYAEFLNFLEVAVLDSLNSFHCVFLGLSMTDPNLLRLLHRAKFARDRTGKGGAYWAIVFGKVLPELARVLDGWGLLVVDLVGDSNDFNAIPTQILACLAQVNPPDVGQIEKSFDRLILADARNTAAGSVPVP